MMVRNYVVATLWIRSPIPTTHEADHGSLTTGATDSLRISSPTAAEEYTGPLLAVLQGPDVRL